jgi:hypothetical protein
MRRGARLRVRPLRLWYKSALRVRRLCLRCPKGVICFSRGREPAVTSAEDTPSRVSGGRVSHALHQLRCWCAVYDTAAQAASPKGVICFSRGREPAVANVEDALSRVSGGRVSHTLHQCSRGHHRSKAKYRHSAPQDYGGLPPTAGLRPRLKQIAPFGFRRRPRNPASLPTGHALAASDAAFILPQQLHPSGNAPSHGSAFPLAPTRGDSRPSQITCNSNRLNSLSGAPLNLTQTLSQNSFYLPTELPITRKTIGSPISFPVLLASVRDCSLPCLKAFDRSPIAGA